MQNMRRRSRVGRTFLTTVSAVAVFMALWAGSSGCTPGGSDQGRTVAVPTGADAQTDARLRNNPNIPPQARAAAVSQMHSQTRAAQMQQRRELPSPSPSAKGSAK
jgi:hypothetical protein